MDSQPNVEKTSSRAVRGDERAVVAAAALVDSVDEPLGQDLRGHRSAGKFFVKIILAQVRVQAVRGQEQPIAGAERQLTDLGRDVRPPPQRLAQLVFRG